MCLTRIVIVLALAGGCGTLAAAEPQLDAQGMLAIAKQTGACGILASQSAFQASTKLEGGDEFIRRFWTTEAARLGKTPEQYIEDCQRAIAAYDAVFEAAESRRE